MKDIKIISPCISICKNDPKTDLCFGCAGVAFLFDMLTVFALYLNLIFYARLIFGLCCLSLFFSIILYLGEIFVSTRALKLHLSDMKIDEE